MSESRSTQDLTARGAGRAKPLVWDNHACPPMDPQAPAFVSACLERYRSACATVVSLNTGYGETPRSDHLRLVAQLCARHAWD